MRHGEGRGVRKGETSRARGEAGRGKVINPELGAVKSQVDQPAVGRRKRTGGLGRHGR